MILKIKNIIKFSAGDLETITEIPTGNWLLKVNDNTGEYYLEKQPAFTLPEKVYGDVYKNVDRYLRTFSRRDKNLGILLKGLKGTGKSLTAKCLCMASDLPVILITEPFSGPAFQSFLSNITQECIIFIDEFEKTFQTDDYRDSQSSLLSIFDGVFQGKKLFLLTANNTHTINNALLNRPGRIHYLREYEGLPQDVIREVGADLLDDKTQLEDLLQVFQVVGEVNMDMVISLITEMNMYKENAREAITHLNITPGQSSYEVIWNETKKDNLGIEREYTFYTEVHYHPLAARKLSFYGYTKDGFKSSNSGQIDLEKMNITSDNDGKIFLKHKEGHISYEFIPAKPYKFVF